MNRMFSIARLVLRRRRLALLCAAAVLVGSCAETAKLTVTQGTGLDDARWLLGLPDGDVRLAEQRAVRNGAFCVWPYSGQPVDVRSGFLSVAGDALGGCAVAAAWPLATVAADPLKSPACILALDQLQQLENTAAAAQRHPAQNAANKRSALHAVQAQQRRTALACQLDTDPPAPPPVARMREPLRVAPVVVPPAAPVRRPAEAVPEQRPVTLGACDEQGCWTSDGRRLSRAGSLLIGPGGFCTQQGSVLRCP